MDHPRTLNEIENRYSTRNWFIPWSWAITRDKWDKHFRMIEVDQDLGTSKYVSWDVIYCNEFVKNGYLEAYPLVPRCINIGINGVHQRGMMVQNEKRKITSDEVDIPTTWVEICN